MSDNTTNEELIHFLRQITADGIVDKQEIWDLGTFLHVNDDAREQWPGPMISKILQGIFEDKVVTDDEAADLTERLRGIEKECHDRNVTVGVGIEPSNDYAVSELALPVVEFQAEIEASLPGRAPSRVGLSGHTCTCEDWRKHRAAYPAASIGRLCW
jgi:hypothetical protein